jgi:hypothetical protein
MWAQRPVAREALLAATGAAVVTALVAWLGPGGGDLAAHEYQRSLFLAHGFTLWDDYWYAGRYSFVGYSVLYYPLAAFLGIKVLAVLEVAAAAGSFALLVGKEWGRGARWASRAFALLWAGVPITGEYPFALGVSLGLGALVALQHGRRWAGAALTLLTLAASPVAFLLLAVVLVGTAVARRPPLHTYALPCAALVAGAAGELVIVRLFPPGGALGFPAREAAEASAFCLGGIALVWRVEKARVLRGVLAAYLVAVLAAYAIPSALGHDVARLQLLALPLVVLLVSLRGWRPLPLAAAVVALAVAWNVTPLATNWAQAEADVTASASVWTVPLAYLHSHLRPNYRVEAVDTTEHWPAFYLASAGIPLVRGWFRQDDLQVAALLYRRPSPSAYLRWLRSLGVAYVVLTKAPPDYSSRREAGLVRSGRAHLRLVLATPEISIYAVRRPRPIVTGPGPATVLALRQQALLLHVPQRGTYRIAVRWSPYWRSSTGCLLRGPHGMLWLRLKHEATVRISFDVDGGSLWRAFAGTKERCALPASR